MFCYVSQVLEEESYLGDLNIQILKRVIPRVKGAKLRHSAFISGLQHAAADEEAGLDDESFRKLEGSESFMTMQEIDSSTDVAAGSQPQQVCPWVHQYLLKCVHRLLFLGIYHFSLM